MMRNILFMAITCALAGCATTPPEPMCPTKPVLVDRQVPVYMDPPAELLREHPDPFPAPLRTVGDAVEAAKLRGMALEACNSNTRAIREWSAGDE